MQASTRLELMISAIPVKCSNKLSYHANLELVIFEFVRVK